MKNYVIASRTTGGLTIVSLVLVFCIHNGCSGTEAEFWCNVFLAVFGSALLTFITSIIGYITEKRSTLEGFWYSTYSLLRIINKYDVNWELEQKIDFYLTYVDIDKYLWDSQFGSIYFMNDLNREKAEYIYNNIYKPLLDFNGAICKHEFHFRWHQDGGGKNKEVMAIFVNELESIFIKETSNVDCLENNETSEMPLIEKQLVKNIHSELNGRYYKLLYGKSNKKEEK